HVADQHGNGLDRANVALDASREGGRFDPIASLGNGDFLARYHPPASCASGPVKVLAVAGEARDEVTVSLASRPARAGLTVSLLGQSNFGRLFSPGIAVEGDVRLAPVHERLSASVALELTSASLSASGQLGDANPYTVDAQPLILSTYVGPRWTFFERDRAVAFAGA